MEIRIEDFITQKVAPFFISHVTAKPFTNTVQDRIGMRRRTFVVSPLHDGIHRVRPHYDDIATRLVQRKHPVVVQQDQRLAGNVQGHLLVRLAIHRVYADAAPRHQRVVVHFPEGKTGFQQTTETGVDTVFRYQSPIDCRFQLHVIPPSAFQVRPAAHSRSTGRSGIGMRLVQARVEKVTDGTAIAHHHIFKSPFVAQDLMEQAFAPATGFSLETLIGTHHFFHIGFLDQYLESRQVSLPQIARVKLFHVEIMTLGFRPAMHGIMFRTSMQLVVLGIRRTLQAPDHSHTHPGSQVRVFSPSLLPPSPPGIAEDVHIGRPKRQSFVHLPVAAFFVRIVIFRTSLVAYRRVHGLHGLIVEHGSHTHGDGINRSDSATGHSVQRLAPPVIRLDAQTLHCGRRINHQRSLLFQRQSLHQILSPFTRRQIRILVRFVLCPTYISHGQP